jgi:hypothetical protein
MSPMISDLQGMLQNLQPRLHPGVYVFCAVPADADVTQLATLAMLREAEGISLVLREEDAVAAGLSARFRAAWISLQVHSDLAGVGLSAAVASALAEQGIACNVMAGVHHDHLFVPLERAADALAALLALQRSAP